MKAIILLLCFSIFMCPLAKGQSRHSMHPMSQMNDVKKQIADKKEPVYSAYLQLLHYADSIQNVPHHALADFAVPGFYDFPEEHRSTSLALQQDAFAAYSSALAYRLSGNNKYGEKACYFLNAWSRINQKYSEHDGPLVMVYSGTALVIAAELMSDQKIWKEQDKNEFIKWLIHVYRNATNEIRIHKNNWADWGRFGSLLSASFLDDQTEIDENIRLIKSDLALKIGTDGSMTEEVKRKDNGIWYSYFSLAPITASCWLVYNLTGENLFNWNHKQASIKKALDYMTYYNQHPHEWKWYKNPNAGGPDMWPANLLEAMTGIYNEPQYTDYVKRNRPIMYSVHHFAWSFPTLMPLKLNYSNR